MDGYRRPAGFGVSEFTEKRSRFIGHVWPVDCEAEARERIAETRAKYHDARHNCWCYLLREEHIVRYSDDGEPQGSAGQPMLEVFRHEGVENICCVVTRYFGGVLLGTGGLARAYTRAAKDALTAAGTAEMRRWERVRAACGYDLAQRLEREAQTRGGRIVEMTYGAQVALTVLFPDGCAADYIRCAAECSAGRVVPEVQGSELLALPE